MSDPVEFGFYNRGDGVDISLRSLPHWFQPNTAIFVTFRTADSLPRDVLLRWDEEQRQWLIKNGIAADFESIESQALPVSIRKEFCRFRERRRHWHLDSCHGACLLRQKEIADIVMSSLLHFNGERYDLDSAVIMPNHVHLLAQFYPPTTCRIQCESWLHFTALKINQRLQRKGQFWQSEAFDHLVRNAGQFAYLQRYILDNGTNANLSQSDYLVWKRE